MCHASLRKGVTLYLRLCLLFHCLLCFRGSLLIPTRSVPWKHHADLPPEWAGFPWVEEEAAAARPGLQGPDKDGGQRKAGKERHLHPPRGESQGGCPRSREQWVLDFSGSLMRQLMERVTEASPGRIWRVDKWNYCGGRF